MIKFIIGITTKGMTDFNDIRARLGYVSGLVGIISNFILFFIKLFVGISIKSIAVTSDAFNNLSDSGSSLITMFGFYMGTKPADKEHPFGHGRIEYITAFVVSFIIVLVGFEFLRTSIGKIIMPSELVFDPILTGILVVSVLIKLWQSYFNKTISDYIQSDALKATAFDSLSDVFATLITIVSILLYHFFNINIDGYAGVLVSLVIMYAGYSLLKETLTPLLGSTADPNLVREVKTKLMQYDGIIGIHDMMVHSYGPYMSVVNVHVEVPENVHIIKSHEVIDTAEREIGKELNILLLCHMDPISLDDTRINDIRDKVMHIVKSIDETLSIHDFRLVDGESHINLIFDVDINYSYDDKRSDELIMQIEDMVKKLDKRYHCVIKLDKGFV